MTPEEYIHSQPELRRELLTGLHRIISDNDSSVDAEVAQMMGKEMILYKASGIFKYGLASGKEHMTLHLMPMYCLPAMYDKYNKLLAKAKFQKGCINFKNAADVPLPVVKDLITECAPINLPDLLASLKQNRK